MTLGEAIEAVPPRATAALPEGSWGEGGDHRVWLNRDTEWTWDRVYSAEAEWVEQPRQPATAATPSSSACSPRPPASCCCSRPPTGSS